MFRNALKRVYQAGAAGALVVSGSAFAALDSADVTALQSEVIADVGVAFAAGMAVLTVALAADVGMSLLKKFIKKGK